MSRAILILGTLCIISLAAVNATAAAEMIKVGTNVDFGSYLTDANGVTLYMFEIDYAGVSVLS